MIDLNKKRTVVGFTINDVHYEGLELTDERISYNDLPLSVYKYEIEENKSHYHYTDSIVASLRSKVNEGFWGTVLTTESIPFIDYECSNGYARVDSWGYYLKKMSIAEFAGISEVPIGPEKTLRVIPAAAQMDHYAGVDIELISNKEGQNTMSNPRVLVEYNNEEHKLKAYIWRDPHSEDCTDIITLAEF